MMRRMNENTIQTETQTETLTEILVERNLSNKKDRQIIKTFIVVIEMTNLIIASITNQHLHIRNIIKAEIGLVHPGKIGLVHLGKIGLVHLGEILLDHPREVAMNHLLTRKVLNQNVEEVDRLEKGVDHLEKDEREDEY